MKVRLYPGERIASVYTISYQKLWDQGIRGILYDIDNTLVPDNAPADSRSEALFHQLHAIGFRTCLVSNNRGCFPSPKLYRARLYAGRISRLQQAIWRAFAGWGFIQSRHSLSAIRYSRISGARIMPESGIFWYVR